MPTSLSSYYPFSSGAGAGLQTEQQWSDWARLIVSDGVINLGLASYDLNKLAGSADGGGMYVLIASGRVQIKGHHGKLDAQETMAISAAHATLGRLDRVVVRLNWSTKVIELDVLAGTPHATPLTGLTALTQTDGVTWEIEILRVTVGAAVSAISGGAVSDVRPYATAVVADAAVTNEKASFTWTTFAPTLGQGGTVTHTVSEARYLVVGKLLHVRLSLAATAVGTGSNAITITLPTSSPNLTLASSGAVSAIGNAIVQDTGTDYKVGSVVATSTTVLSIMRDGKANYLGTSSDAMTLASGDLIGMQFTAELA